MINWQKIAMYIVLGALVAGLITLFIQNKRLKNTIEDNAETQIEQNNNKVDELEEEDKEDKSSRNENLDKVQELEKQKSKPYGKKDFTNNESVTDAERYFSKRYGTDSIKDR